MLEEVVWTSSAAGDYLASNSNQAPTQAIDGLLELIRLFPEMGTRVGTSGNLRRALVGRQRCYGLYYSIQGNRLIVVALLDLTQDPGLIEKILKSRRPGE